MINFLKCDIYSNVSNKKFQLLTLKLKKFFFNNSKRLKLVEKKCFQNAQIITMKISAVCAFKCTFTVTNRNKKIFIIRNQTF